MTSKEFWVDDLPNDPHLKQKHTIIMTDINLQIASETRMLALLTAQADRMRIELARLRRDVAEAQRDLDKVQSGFFAACDNDVREANERLVIAALESEAKAEIAVNDYDELSRSSQRDALTGTPNRTLMLDRLNKAIANARRRNAHIALLFLDIDKFKYINDTKGHSVGDEVVQAVARRLQSVVRDADTVSRHGGDEFLILLADIGQASDAALIAEKILAAIALPISIQGHELIISVSLGITIFPEDGENAEALIKRADEAMYISKREKDGGVKFYENSLSKQ
jgi:diguanylate cyclase (GGDEF)-like protein